MAYKYIFGIQSFANQDSGAALIKASDDGELVDYIAISEERLIRVKYPYVFPVHSIGCCMERFGLESLEQIDLLVVDNIRIPRWFRSGPSYNTSEFDYLKIKFGIDPRKTEVINHHMAHAASTYYMSGFDDSAILIVDGNGSDLETTSYYNGDGLRIDPIENFRFQGIGSVYSAVTKNILNLGTGGEGKTMGLAPFGAKHPKALDINPDLDGIKNDFSQFIRRMPNSDVLNQKYPEQRLEAIKIPYTRCKNKEDLLNPYFSRVAYDVQDITEKTLVHLARDLHKKTGKQNLCVAGGVGLNSVANKIMLDESDFKNIFIFPACSDSGIPLGLALYGYYHSEVFKDVPKKKLVFTHSYTGPEYPDDHVGKVIERAGIAANRMDLSQVAGYIAEGKIIGWWQGRSEYGPRALGHRSILADSRNPQMQDIVNKRVKHREAFRPFAPSILAEYSSEYFDLDCPSPYMLLIADVKQPDVIPSITHVDNTARVQTVTKEDNGIFYDLIEEFYKITGVPCILNTSFNDAGEPMVETPEDAIICFLKTDMDYLVLGDYCLDITKINIERVLPFLEKEREKAISVRRENLISKFFPGYDTAERDIYIEESNKMSEWHVKYRSKYELEKMTNIWARDKTRIIIVGTRDHTATLPKTINEFYNLEIVGFIDFNGKLDKDKTVDIPYSIFTLDDLDSIDFDVILVSSWEYNFDIEQFLIERGLKDKSYVIYDNASRSFMDTLVILPEYSV